MKNSLVLVVLTALLALPMASASAQELALTGDMRALQGTWRVSFADDVSIVVEIKNDTLTMTTHTPKGRGEQAKGSFTLDETQNPKHMTWKDVEGGRVKIDVNRCIYELHGDTWLLIGGKNERPKLFLAGEGKPHTTFIFKREKLTSDLQALQGKWRASLADDVSIVVEIKNDTFTMTTHTPKGRGEPARGSFTLDETQNPKHMTWVDVAGGGMKLDLNRCIYELHGDTWLLIGGKNERPKLFLAGAGKPHRTLIFKREK